MAAPFLTLTLQTLLLIRGGFLDNHSWTAPLVKEHGSRTQMVPDTVLHGKRIDARWVLANGGKCKGCLLAPDSITLYDDIGVARQPAILDAYFFWLPPFPLCGVHANCTMSISQPTHYCDKIMVTLEGFTTNINRDT